MTNHPDPTVLRRINFYLAAVLYVIGLLVAVQWGIGIGRDKAPEMRCKGTTYVAPDGTRTCEPNLKHCPRGTK